ncbi:hypothetical protein [Oceanicola sp. 502str15]|uniref:hypothetical protein n=1 Tax=Oceanicola sp. 502str15 TaxID=2696061 RepID=UPI002095A017|nr:hypothetical protein [Oceanicola sp. 502str15]MCO6382790.1 hypothetical protein [Oceanicola sp. 502str15]
MPKLVSLYLRNVLIGFALAALFVAGLLWFDVANLWHLMTHSPDGALAVFMLFMFNGIVFSGVQFGIAVMSMAVPKDPGIGGMTALMQPLLVSREPDPAHHQRKRGFGDF